ncbi:MAG: TetR/AcrR family transcriptional regulator [Propionibacteriaceae bacterium]
MVGVTSRRVGLDPDKIANHALAVTRLRGLNSWSVRELAAEIGVAPSVIYHYYPTKNDIYDAVSAKVCQLLKMPADELLWHDWFLALLLDFRTLLLAHNGVARWLVDRSQSGKPLETLIPIMEMAIQKLSDAGFGEYTPTAYAMISNVSFGAITGRDKQSPKDHHRHDIEQMVKDLSPIADRYPAVASMRENFLMTLYGEGGEQASERYFRILLSSLFDGMSHVLLPAAGSSQQQP